MTACSARVSGFVFREAGSASLSASERFHISTEDYQDQFRIDVAVPEIACAPGCKLPVIYVLDGGWNFATAAQTARALSIGPGAIPHAILVGVSPAIDGPHSFARATAARYRDLAYSVDAEHVAQMRRRLPPRYWPQELGQAARFRRFIERDLKPFIAGYYDVDEGDQTLLGVSLGGLFVLHALFESPGSFQRHVAISPSIWWNERAVLAAEERAARLGGVRGHLFLGVGEQEEAQAPEAGMVSNLVDLSDRLKARDYPDLRVTRHIFEGEGHMSVAPAAISRGLRAVFAS